MKLDYHKDTIFDKIWDYEVSIYFKISQCFGTPSKCQDCTEICTFEEGEQKAVVKSSDFLGSDNTNGECVYDCNPDGADPRYPEIPSCRVEFKPHGVYSGDIVGLCFFSDNSCRHTPPACQKCNQHCNINPLISSKITLWKIKYHFD